MIKLKSAAVGFKEWLLVCDALASGRQSLIIRKGGIAEGRGGFQWQCREFFLFPTLFHQQREQVTWTPTGEAEADLAQENQITIRHAARLEWHARVGDWTAAAALQAHHVWKEEVIRDRFGYGDDTGLSVGVVRVFRLAEPKILPMEPRFGGCRSWVDLPELAEGAGDGWTPVLSDEAHAERIALLETLLPGRASGVS